MGREFHNVHDDDTGAESYARLGFAGTYYLAFRDLPAIFARHITGRRALDLGCGTGRSTRFPRCLGFNAVGVDVWRATLDRAMELDSRGGRPVFGRGLRGAVRAHSAASADPGRPTETLDRSWALCLALQREE